MTYTVQAGDTLWAIARKYNCSITEIVAANSDADNVPIDGMRYGNESL